MKEKVSISLCHSFGEYDVEVFTWIDLLKTSGELIEELTNYAYPTQDKAQAYIKELAEEYEVMEVNHTSDEEKYNQEDESDDFNEDDQPMMDEDEFWNIIELSLEQQGTEEQRLWLIDLLVQMSDEKIWSFENRMREIGRYVYNHENMVDAYRLAGVWGGDDSYSYFCSWLISRGKDIMDDVLANPMEVKYYLNSKNLTEDGARNELFGYVSVYALDKKALS